MLSPAADIEREVKLEVGLRFTLPHLNGVLPGVVAVGLPLAKLRAVYLDTADLRLMRWGITLRHRQDIVAGGSGESEWTVKLPHDADGVALVRREVSWPGKFGPVPAEVLSLVKAQARSSPIVAVAKLHTQRRRVELRDAGGGKLAEIDDDIVSVMDGRILAARFREVEVEVAAGAPDELLHAVLERLTAAGALCGDDRPKVVRALGPRATSPPDVVVPKLGREATVADVVSASIAGAMTRMVRHDPGVRLGDDPEHVHQARVGTRRLRSDLRTFRRLLDPEWLGRVRGELGWLADALGEVRDTDVLTERLRGQIAALPDSDTRPSAGLLRRLALQRDVARAKLLAVLDSDRYVALLDELARASAQPPLAAPPPAAASAPAPARSQAPAPAPAPAADPSGQGLATSTLPPGAGPAPVGVPSVVAATRFDAGLSSPAGGAAPGSQHGSEPAALAEGVTTSDDLAPTAASKAASAADRPASAAHAPALAADGPAAFAIDPVLPFAADPPLGPTSANGNGTAGARGVGDRPAREVLPGLVRKPWKHLRRAATGLGDDPPNEALHQVRICAKRLRYAAEAAAPVIGKPAKRLAAAVAEVQGVLGDMQDAVVAEAWLRQAGMAGPPSQALVAGVLIARQRDQQAACRKAWSKPWRKASAKQLRSWL
jgi:CHAD domain-containing protein